MLHLDYRDGRPIYEQVADGIEQLVAHNVLEADSQLPSVRQLAVELSINPNTVQRAYGALESKGVIYSVKGKGNFVSSDSTQVRQRRIDELHTQLHHLVQDARLLDVAPATLITWIHEEEQS